MRGKQHRARRSGWVRRAAATVEMAVVTPILLAFMFGIIEYGWVFMLQSNLTSAARDACRVGILPGTTDNDIKTRFTSALTGTGLTASSYTVNIARSTTNNLETITVTARVPWNKASLVGGGVLPDPRKLLTLCGGSNTTKRTSDLVASCTMMKEGTQ